MWNTFAYSTTSTGYLDYGDVLGDMDARQRNFTSPGGLNLLYLHEICQSVS